VNRKVAVNLFSGAGGTSRGLEQAGYDVLGYEKWDDAVATHRMNRMECEQVDLKDETLFNNAGDPVDVMWGSPPCQPWSQQNSKKVRHLDPRDCIPDYLRIVSILRPRCTIMENVTGLVGAKSADYLAWIVSELEEGGTRFAGRF
jgi:DNA (cytosine-5)-methyltransferase 1